VEKRGQYTQAHPSECYAQEEEHRLNFPWMRDRVTGSEEDDLRVPIVVFGEVKGMFPFFSVFPFKFVWGSVVWVGVFYNLQKFGRLLRTTHTAHLPPWILLKGS
jgi:hypothetical protein